MDALFVIDRRGARVPYSPEAIAARGEALCSSIQPPLARVDMRRVVALVERKIRPGILTSEIDQATIDVCSGLCVSDPEYGEFAARVAVSNLQKQTSACVLATVKRLCGMRKCGGRAYRIGEEEIVGMLSRAIGAAAESIREVIDADLRMLSAAAPPPDGRESLTDIMTAFVDAVAECYAEFLLARAPEVPWAEQKEALAAIETRISRIADRSLDGLRDEAEDRGFRATAVRTGDGSIDKCIDAICSLRGVFVDLGRDVSNMSDEYVAIIERGYKQINARMQFDRDYQMDFFGVSTMMKAYQGKEAMGLGDQAPRIVERAQHTFVRAAIQRHVCQPDRRGHLASDYKFFQRIEDALNDYDLTSQFKIVHASPSVTNAGRKEPQLSSCYLLSVPDDMNGLLTVLKDAGMISKCGGGIGISITAMRARGSTIWSTGGKSSGPRRYIQLCETMQCYIDQGGVRPGAFAMFMETWHDDVFEFLETGRREGAENSTPELKFGLVIGDQFMEALVDQLERPDDPESGRYYLFDPASVPKLVDSYGDEFRELYDKYVREKRYRRAVRAGDIMTEWFITNAQAGTPYTLFKDHMNRKSNLKWRTIRGSNLCCEITIPSFFDEADPSKSEYGVCNLGSVPLANHLRKDARANNKGGVRIDWSGIIDAAAALTRNLNKVIDVSYCPVAPGVRSNTLHRPIAIGSMGLANILCEFGYEYGSAPARALDMALHAAIYYGAMRESARLAFEHGPHETFPHTEAARGLIQPDLWERDGHLAPGWAEQIEAVTEGALAADRWPRLRESVRRGVRNCYVTASMPTATSSRPTKNHESFEPFASNVSTHTTQAGSFVTHNRYLVRDLEALGLWDERMKRDIAEAAGSVQGIERVPADLKRMYVTARELGWRAGVEHAAARGPFISQTMSLNHWVDVPTFRTYCSIIVSAWRRGLVTGSYYIHSTAAGGAGAKAAPKAGAKAAAKAVCTAEVCTACAL